jgi:hypothetical protein
MIQNYERSALSRRVMEKMMKRQVRQYMTARTSTMPIRRKRMIITGEGTNLLAMTRHRLIALGTMDESGSLGVEAMKAVGMLVHESVVLRDKLPANLGRVRRSSRRCCRRCRRFRRGHRERIGWVKVGVKMGGRRKQN